MTEMRWCSYRELADAWSVSLEAAKARVRRSGWRRVAGNDGVVKVEAPATVLATLSLTSPPTSSATLSPTPSPLDTPAALTLVNELHDRAQQAETQLEAMQARLADALALAASAQDERQHLQREVNELRVALTKAQAEREAARAVAIADVEAAKHVAKSEIAAKDALIEELRAMLAEARKPWWRRLIRS
jgi:hypothetical protein